MAPGAGPLRRDGTGDGRQLSRTAADDFVRLAAGPVEVEVLPRVGARLHRLRAFGHDLLHTPNAPAAHQTEPFLWGAYVMAPWCNRIEARPTEVRGRVVDVPASFADGTAIHGLVHDARWTVADAAAAEARFAVEHDLGGWPWRFRAELAITLDDATVTLEQRLTNLDDAPMPGGLGLHPWFRRPQVAALHAGRALPSVDSELAEPQPVSGDLDLRSAGGVPLGLDAAWTDLEDPAAELAWPDLRLTLELSVTPRRWLVAATPPDRPGVAIEPQSHAPGGLRRLLAGQVGGLTWLEPDEVLEQRTTLRIRQGAPGVGP